MTSRVWSFEGANKIPEWDKFAKVKSAIWVESGFPAMYNGFLELHSPEKVSCCKKMVEATWFKCDRHKRTEFEKSDKHHVYESERVLHGRKQDFSIEVLQILTQLQAEVSAINDKVTQLLENNTHTTINNITNNITNNT